MTDHASDFPKPPVSIAELTTRKDAFDQAMVEMTDAGPSTTAAKNAARKALVDALRKNALFVEIAANNDLSLLLTSGYQAARIDCGCDLYPATLRPRRQRRQE